MSRSRGLRIDHGIWPNSRPSRSITSFPLSTRACTISNASFCDKVKCLAAEQITVLCFNGVRLLKADEGGMETS